MRPDTLAEVDGWWAELFDVARPWGVSTVRRHRMLGDYPGWYVAWRGDAVHVSAPASATASEIEALSSTAPSTLRAQEFWSAYAAEHGMQLLGPATHAYLDAGSSRFVGAGPGETPSADADESLATLRAAVTSEEWEESGFADQPGRTFCVREQGRVVAAANLNPWDGTPRDVGVLVAADCRGRGLATSVGRQAASWAISHHGMARWRTLESNLASARAARRLGFQVHATQLALRP